LVTGAGRGIGRGIVEIFADEGADVAVNDIADTGTFDEVVAAARAKGRRAVPVIGDVSKRSDVEAMIEKAWHELGGLDILVNNGRHRNHRAVSRADRRSVDEARRLRARVWFGIGSVLRIVVARDSSTRSRSTGTRWMRCRLPGSIRTVNPCFTHGMIMVEIDSSRNTPPTPVEAATIERKYPDKERVTFKTFATSR